MLTRFSVLLETYLGLGRAFPLCLFVVQSSLEGIGKETCEKLLPETVRFGPSMSKGRQTNRMNGSIEGEEHYI